MAELEVRNMYGIATQLRTNSHYAITMGDFTAEIGISNEQDEITTGKFGSEKRMNEGTH